MPSFTLDDVEIPFEKGQDILTAALQTKQFLPHYCYHPGLTRAATCRMCLVDIVDAGNGRAMPKLQASCSTPAADGMKVVSKNEKVHEAREAVMEFLLINHPLDCPICDQAGECSLQDYSFEYGTGKSTMQAQKRVYGWRDIGTFIQLERNRCIQCTRCVRFTQEITETSEMGMFQRGHELTVDTFVDRPLSDLFQGNLADICPVGALTSKDFRFRKRVWKLKKTQSVCTDCSTGCNIDVHHYQGAVHRFSPRENQDVNRWWMCDPGRTGFHSFFEKEKRQQGCFVKGKPADWKEALESAANSIKELKLEKHECVVIGSNQSTVEELFSLKGFVEKYLPEAWFFGVEPPAEGEEKPVWVENLITEDKSPNSQGLKLLGYDLDGSEKKLKKINWDKIKCLIMMGEASSHSWAKEALKKSSFSLLVSTFKTSLSEHADVTFSSQTHLEKNGSFVNKKGRLQKISAVVKGYPGSRNDLAIFHALSNNISREETPLLSPNGTLKKVAESNEHFKVLQETPLTPLGVQLTVEQT